MVKSFALTATNLLLMADGLDYVQRWDGYDAAPVTAGVLAPTAAVALAGSGSGNIAGTYYAYERFIDSLGNVSSLSPISAAFTPSGAAGVITAASNATPIVVTSAAHGLATGRVVTVESVAGNIDANGTWAVTVVDANSFSLDTSSGNVDYTGGGTWRAGVGTVTYTAVQVPTETKVVRRQILRNTTGQLRTFYVDVDTTDLVLTTFSSTNDDETLATQESQALLDSSGASLANLHDPPPAHKAVVVSHADRAFYLAEVAYTEGNVVLTGGSTTVTGVATDWKAAFAGRFLYVDGASASYEIASVDAAAQTLTLTAAYGGATSAYSFYAIRPAPAERRLVYFSEAGLPESVPPTNAFGLEENSDDITGGISLKSFLYVLERRHVWRVTFHSDPNDDGGVFLASLRGCINHRCVAVVEDVAYMLDEQGVHAFSGGGQDDPVSWPVQSLFRRDARRPWRVNWAAQRQFHCSLSLGEGLIRWFVCLDGDRHPRHALVYSYRAQRWWIEGYAAPVTSSCVGRIGHPTATWRYHPEQLYFGSAAGRVLAHAAGPLDGPDDAGTTRGTATSSTWFSLTDAGADFAAGGLVGSPLALTGGTGKGQVRLVASVSGTTVTVAQPWTTKPDPTTVYQLGGAAWSYLSRWFEFSPGEIDVSRSVRVLYEPTELPLRATLKRYLNRAKAPEAWGVTATAEQNQGVATAAAGPDAELSLDHPASVVQLRLDGHRETNSDGARFCQVGLAGVTAAEPVTLNGIDVEGVQ